MDFDVVEAAGWNLSLRGMEEHLRDTESLRLLNRVAGAARQHRQTGADRSTRGHRLHRLVTRREILNPGVEANLDAGGFGALGQRPIEAPAIDHGRRWFSARVIDQKP